MNIAQSVAETTQTPRFCGIYRSSITLLHSFRILLQNPLDTHPRGGYYS